MLCFVGQGYVFEEGEEILAQTLGIDVSAKQIQKVSEHYGGKLEEQQEQYKELKAAPPRLEFSDDSAPVYMMTDGSMVFTREDGWKEMKVGRIFSESDRITIQPERNEILQSHYLCHFGTHQGFTGKWEPYLEGYKNKVFIADGASWIWNWVEDTYPEATQILDYFHAVEKLALFATHQYPQDQQRKEWLEMQKKALLNNEAKAIIERLKYCIGRNQEAQKAKTDVMRYFENNLRRMQYKDHLERGYLIGSGPIESAHRNIVQQRLKLSGQRWTINGAQKIVNLRACKKSGLWREVLGFISKAA
jgi:hypothetical protein